MFLKNRAVVSSYLDFVIKLNHFFFVGEQLPVGDDDDDRKRIKERLKEAVECDKRARSRVVTDVTRESWFEYIFGICEPDRRVGKQGSR